MGTKLVPPEIAYAWIGTHHNHSQGWAMNKKPGKFHLAKIIHDHTIHTVCGHIITMGGENTILTEVRTLEPDQICVRCLGAMRAEVYHG